MGRLLDLTVVQKTIIDTLHKEGMPQTFIVKEAGCSQSAVSKHVNRKLSGRKKCGRCTTNRENRSLMRIVKQNRFKNLGEVHKEWIEAGVKVSRATTHRRVKEFGNRCRIPLVKPLLNHRQRQRRLTESEWPLLARYVYTYEEFVIVTEAPQCNRMTATGQDTDNKRTIYK